MTSLRILIAPSGFKECLSAERVAGAIARGVRRAYPTGNLVELPLPDGGEGFVHTVSRLGYGRLESSTVRGPLGEPVVAPWAVLREHGQSIAVIETASAAGLGLVPPGCRDPGPTSTFGVGQLIRVALDAGVDRILIGCGDSGTNDGGAGMAQALDAQLLDEAGHEIGPGGLGLLSLDRIDLSGLDPRLAGVRIEVACNTHNLLCGERGVSRVFAPQKGASPERVLQLEAALERFADIVARDCSVAVAELPGGGASGGLGAGLHAFLGARLVPRYDIVSRYLDLDRQIAEADIVLTAEGGIDRQSAYGKMPGEVAARAQLRGVPVIALAGTIGVGAETLFDRGVVAYFSIVGAPCSLDAAMERAEQQIADCAENVMRAILAGVRIAASLAQPHSHDGASR